MQMDLPTIFTQTHTFLYIYIYIYIYIIKIHTQTNLYLTHLYILNIYTRMTHVCIPEYDDKAT